MIDSNGCYPSEQNPEVDLGAYRDSLQVQKSDWWEKLARYCHRARHWPTLRILRFLQAITRIGRDALSSSFLFKKL